MLKKIVLAAALVAASAIPAFAQSCSEPIPPVAPNGATANKAQISAAAHDANLFIKASDDYQGCLITDLNNQKDAAKKDKKELDPAIGAAVTAKVDANQAMKERVGSEFTTAYAAFKKSHPGEQ